jgi:hypothetical protein
MDESILSLRSTADSIDDTCEKAKQNAEAVAVVELVKGNE